MTQCSGSYFWSTWTFAWKSLRVSVCLVMISTVQGKMNLIPAQGAPPGTKRDTPKQQQEQAYQLTIWCSTKGKQNWVDLNSGENQIVTRWAGTQLRRQVTLALGGWVGWLDSDFNFWFFVFGLWFLTRWAGTQLRRQVTLALGWWVGGSMKNLGFDESSWP